MTPCSSSTRDPMAAASWPPAAVRLEFGVGGGPGQGVVHRVDARREPAVDRAGAPVGGFRKIGEPGVDDAGALVGGLRQRGDARSRNPPRCGARLRPATPGDGRTSKSTVVRCPSRAAPNSDRWPSNSSETFCAWSPTWRSSSARWTSNRWPTSCNGATTWSLNRSTPALSERETSSARPVKVRVDILGEAREGLGQVVDPFLQRLADLGRLGVQAAHQLPAALAERPGVLERVAGERLRHGASALRKALVDLVEQALDRSRNFPELRRGAVFERRETRFEHRRRLVVPADELFVDRAAAGDERVFERGELGGEVAGQSVRAIADLRDDFAAAAVDGALEAGEPVAERDLDAPGVRRERRVDGVEMRRRNGLELPEPLGGLGREVFEMSAEAPVEILPAAAHDGVDGFDVPGDAGVQLVRMGRDPVDDAVPVLAHQTVERLEIGPHPFGLAGQRFDQPASVLADDGVERGHLLAERIVDAAGADGDRGRRLARQRDEPLGDLGGFRVEPGERRRGGRLEAGLGR